MADGDILEVSASDPGFTRDIESWCRRTGNTLISKGKKGKSYVAVIRKGIAAGESGGSAGASGVPAVSGAGADAAAAGAPVAGLPQGKTIIVFDGDLDKVLAAFVIANGALAMGRPVTMFFTFWGLTALRKTDKQKLRKSKKAMENGVRIVACSMSMDVMGIRKEELIDGVEIGGVGTYLADAEESNVNLFI